MDRTIASYQHQPYPNRYYDLLHIVSNLAHSCEKFQILTNYDLKTVWKGLQISKMQRSEFKKGEKKYWKCAYRSLFLAKILHDSTIKSGFLFNTLHSTLCETETQTSKFRFHFNSDLWMWLIQPREKWRERRENGRKNHTMRNEREQWTRFNVCMHIKLLMVLFFNFLTMNLVICIAVNSPKFTIKWILTTIAKWNYNGNAFEFEFESKFIFFRYCATFGTGFGHINWERVKVTVQRDKLSFSPLFELMDTKKKIFSMELPRYIHNSHSSVQFATKLQSNQTAGVHYTNLVCKFDIFRSSWARKTHSKLLFTIPSHRSFITHAIQLWKWNQMKKDKKKTPVAHFAQNIFRLWSTRVQSSYESCKSFWGNYLKRNKRRMSGDMNSVKKSRKFFFQKFVSCLTWVETG